MLSTLHPVPAARWHNRLGRDVGFILDFGSSLCGCSAIESPRRGKKILRRNNMLLLRVLFYEVRGSNIPPGCAVWSVLSQEVQLLVPLIIPLFRNLART